MTYCAANFLWGLANKGALYVQKAFDKVDHDILVQKLNHCGIRGVASNWFSSYLKDRFQCVSIRSSHRRCSIKKGVPGNFVTFKGKDLRQSLFLNKVAGLRPATLLKKRLWPRCFPVNFTKFLRTPFSQNTSGRLLLWFKWFKFWFGTYSLWCSSSIYSRTTSVFNLHQWPSLCN